jgi:hypothetical protein
LRASNASAAIQLIDKDWIALAALALAQRVVGFAFLAMTTRMMRAVRVQKTHH